MQRIDPNAYPEAIADLLRAMPLAPLGPGSPVSEAKARLDAIDLGAVTDRRLADCCRAGLYLAFDFLNESHEISQGVSTAEGSFWHAIMHRREPDAWNSKYWWRRVGAHPVLAQLRERSPEVGYRFTSPEDFVDFCERVRGSGSADEEVARQVQRLEWELLFAWCYRAAVGS